MRQRFLKMVYPLWMLLSNITGKKNATYQNRNSVLPPVSFYDLSIELNDGTTLPFSVLKQKKVLLVNTASDCGYTNQYEDLQKLYEEYNDRLVVIGFPSNDFKEQEKGSDEEIAAFCKLNYGVSFPLSKKSTVTGAAQNKVFSWLSDKNKNGWNDQQPSWNFSKYLVNEDGTLLRYFDPGISPMSDELTRLI